MDAYIVIETHIDLEIGPQAGDGPLPDNGERSCPSPALRRRHRTDRPAVVVETA